MNIVTIRRRRNGTAMYDSQRPHRLQCSFPQNVKPYLLLSAQPAPTTRNRTPNLQVNETGPGNVNRKKSFGLEKGGKRAVSV